MNEWAFFDETFVGFRQVFAISYDHAISFQAPQAQSKVSFQVLTPKPHRLRISLGTTESPPYIICADRLTILYCLQWTFLSSSRNNTRCNRRRVQVLSSKQKLVQSGLLLSSQGGLYWVMCMRTLFFAVESADIIWVVFADDGSSTWAWREAMFIGSMALLCSVFWKGQKELISCAVSYTI